MSQLKVAAIMGVGPGLGSAIAHRFAAEGFSISLMARDVDSLTQIQSTMARSDKHISVATDVTNSASVAAAFEQVRSQLGAPEILVYNAGAYEAGGVLDLTPEQFEKAWQINCLGAFLGIQQVLPAMLERQQGTILLTGATASLRGAKRFAGLAVGKFGLRALAQSLAREVGSQGVHVAHIIIDGMINTARVRAMVPERTEPNFLAASAIAETYWQLCQQDRTAWTLELDLRPSTEQF